MNNSPLVCKMLDEVGWCDGLRGFDRGALYLGVLLIEGPDRRSAGAKGIQCQSSVSDMATKVGQQWMPRSAKCAYL